jgi:hypothetical protein
MARFEPLALSVDRAKRIYVVVRAEAAAALWVITPEGERVLSVPIRGGNDLGAHPPVVGYAHRVHLFVDSRIVTVGPTGAVLWEQALEGAFGGAIVTADDELVASEGSSVSAFDGTGRRRVLQRFPDGSVRTPPVLTASGSILVATERDLYCLTRRTRP